MAGIKINDLPALGRDLASTDLFEMSLVGGTGSRKITGQEIMNASKLSVGNTPIVNGAVGKLLFQNTGDVLGETSIFNIDPSNGYLGANTTTPQYPIDMYYNSLGFYLGPTYNASIGPNNGRFYLNSYTGFVFNTSLTTALDIKQNGNILIGTNTDAGFKLDVNGTARVSVASGTAFTTSVSNNGGIAANFSTPGGGSVQFTNGYIESNSLQFRISTNGTQPFVFMTQGTERMRLAPTTGNVLINTTTDDGFKLDVNGTARVSGLVTASLSNYNSTHSGNTTRGFYIVNSADSIVRAGIEYDGTNAFVQLAGRYNNGAAFLRQDGSNGNISFLRSGSEYLRIFGATGNVLINTTTDAGFKLDVNGTARVNNDLTIGSNRYLKAFRWTNDDVTRALQIECNSNYNVDGLNIISWNNNLLNNTKNLVNIGLSSTVGTQSSVSTDFFNSVLIQTAYNFTFGTHTVKGIYYNPTLTSMVNTTHYAFHSTSGRVRFEGLPTSPTGLNAGDLYNNLGVLMIV